MSSDDPLKLCRNLRGEHSGIERLDCKEQEEVDETPNSSWYEFVSVPTVSNKESSVNYDGPPG